MVYYLINTARYNNDSVFTVKSTAKIEKFNNKEEAEKYFISLLEDTDIAFIHTKPSTYNNFIRSEIKTENDMTYGNKNQVRYTKDVNFKLDKDWCITLIL